MSACGGGSNEQQAAATQTVASPIGAIPTVTAPTVDPGARRGKKNPRTGAPSRRALPAAPRKELKADLSTRNESRPMRGFRQAVARREGGEDLAPKDCLKSHTRAECEAIAEAQKNTGPGRTLTPATAPSCSVASSARRWPRRSSTERVADRHCGRTPGWPSIPASYRRRWPPGCCGGAARELEGAYEIEEVEVPEPGPFEAIVRVMAAGVNFNSVWAALASRSRSSTTRPPRVGYHIAGPDASGHRLGGRRGGEPLEARRRGRGARQLSLL